MKDGAHDKVLGAILAGGASRRYGSDKALAMLDGRTLLDRVIDRALPQVDELVISGPSRPQFSIPAIADALPGQGPLAGLCTILRWAAGKRVALVAIFACDTPFIPTDCVAKIRAAIGARQCAVASRVGELQPTCALWRTVALPEVKAAMISGARSLRDALHAVGAATVEFPVDGTGDPFFNINRLQDLEAARIRFERVREVA